MSSKRTATDALGDAEQPVSSKPRLTAAAAGGAAPAPVDPALAPFAASLQEMYDDVDEKATLTAWLVARGYPAEKLGVYSKRQLLAMYTECESLVDNYEPRMMCTAPSIPPELLRAAAKANAQFTKKPTEANRAAKEAAADAIKQWQRDNGIPPRIKPLPVPAALRPKLEKAMYEALAARRPLPLPLPPVLKGF